MTPAIVQPIRDPVGAMHSPLRRALVPEAEQLHPLPQVPAARGPNAANVAAILMCLHRPTCFGANRSIVMFILLFANLSKA